MQHETGKPHGSFIQRTRLWYLALLVIFGLFTVRLFYLQILRHDYYDKQAAAGQLKEYQIPAVRGLIQAHDGTGTVPIVLNQTLYTLFADPKFIKEPAKVADKIEDVIGGKASDYETAMRQPTRYAILAKKLNRDQKSELDKLDEKGIGTREEFHRTYPQGDLAAQLLGFVDDEGKGRYGIEQHLDESLRGVPGQLKAITDAQGVPLLSDPSDVSRSPQNGKNTLLTIDVGMQKQLQDILVAGLKKSNSKSGSALIMDPNNGAIKAMANFPTYQPETFYKVKDANVFNNAAVSSPLEVGSIMKTLTAAAAIDQGVVNTNSSYYDPSQYKIDGYTIKNIEEDGGAGRRNLRDILQLSLNTGATWLLMQMGGGEINAKARNTWHDYMVDRYRFGTATGIEQGFEAEGSVPDPNKGFGLNLQYANTAFGQGMTATPLQMGAALSSVINGGTYYQPRLVDGYLDSNGKLTKQEPKILKKDVVKAETGATLKSLMEYVVEKNYITYKMPKVPAGYSVGGKTGTAEISKPGGGYYEDRFNGTFLGFVGGDKVQYVIVVRVNDPRIDTYAGAGAAAPIFSNLTTMLINNFGVTPRN